MFDPPSDEEIECDSESQSDEVDEEGAEEAESEDEKIGPNKKSQSPWDFSSYSESVADEHFRRSTTSVDEKISNARLHHPIPTTNTDSEENSDSESEPHHQVTNNILLI